MEIFVYIINCLVIINLVIYLAQYLNLQSRWEQFMAYLARKPRGRVSHTYRTDPRNRRLQHQLVEMLRGDIATAKRLLKQQRQRHPGMTDNWYLEKVIYDLERDRRR